MQAMPPKPLARPDRVSLWRYVRLFRQDILSAQPARLYGAWMAEFRTPFFRSCLLNDPELVDLVLRRRPGDFPKSDRLGAGLRPLLGESVFLTNGSAWQRQRRIIDPAFAGGRLREAIPAMWDAAEAAATRLEAEAGGRIEMEARLSHAAADVIFRTLFSLPIENALAQAVFEAFRTYQREQPLLSPAAFLPRPARLAARIPLLGPSRKARAAARRIRALLADLTAARRREIAAGCAPDDLATKIMTTPDPQTGARFSEAEMVDQVAIFFLAGHETSASALAWTLYLLALHPAWQERAAMEAAALPGGCPELAALAGLRTTRDVFREALRLYPPVPMMVREARRDEGFRNRGQRAGTQMVLSPWHLHRHARFWDRPDAFDPGRFRDPAGQASARRAYLPFSAGPRACPGAGFAMAEGVLILARLLRTLRFELTQAPPPVPVAHLTVRARDGIVLRVVRR